MLEDGAWFPGITRRPFDITAGEVVFTTNLSGYQEVFTDPSYLGQIVVMTAPMIGNYGINTDDLESDKPQVNAVVVRELSRRYSNWRASGDLDSWLDEGSVPILEGVDTRHLTRHIRSRGAMKGLIACGEEPSGQAREILAQAPSMEGQELASQATVARELRLNGADSRHHVVAYDFGMKRNIARIFNQHGVDVTVLPARTPASRVRELSPEGLFLSNGPGDPAAVGYAIPHIRELVESGLPTFGICLGHQLLSLAFGASTFKLPYGHRGGNHPVREHDSGRVLITSQNHGFAVAVTTKATSPHNQLEVTHSNLNDGTVEGVRHRTLPAFGVQYHPEASPGPHDARGHFREFIQTLDSQ